MLNKSVKSLISVDLKNIFYIIKSILKILFIFVCVLSAAAIFCLAQEGIDKDKPAVAGEFFGVPVSLDNYYFAKKAVLSFGAKWRPSPQSEEELEELTWQAL